MCLAANDVPLMVWAKVCTMRFCAPTEAFFFFFPAFCRAMCSKKKMKSIPWNNGACRSFIDVYRQIHGRFGYQFSAFALSCCAVWLLFLGGNGL